MGASWLSAPRGGYAPLVTLNALFLVAQTGAYLNGYVSCRVKRWYSFHKFLVERFLGYLPSSGPGSRRQGSGKAGGSDGVPSPPRSPSSFPPEGQGIKPSATCAGGGAPAGGSAVCQDESKRAYSVQEVVDAMPVVLFLHVVGCGECVPGLDELIAREARVSDCPPEVRKLLFRQNDSTNVKMVRHRVKDALAALETIGLTRTALSGEADESANMPPCVVPDEDGGEGSKAKEATVHSATSLTVRRRVEVVLPSSDGAGGRHSRETFVFEQEEDVDNFWRALAVRSRTHMQTNTYLIKSERGDECDSEDAGDGRCGEAKAGGIGGRGATLFETFPMLLKRKTWNNQAFGDCTAAQRESVTALLKRERMTAMDQVNQRPTRPHPLMARGSCRGAPMKCTVGRGSI